MTEKVKGEHQHDSILKGQRAIMQTAKLLLVCLEGDGLKCA